jgi:hypothetical protein
MNTYYIVHYALEKIPDAIDRYVKETTRLDGVLNKQLAGKDYIAGEYSRVACVKRNRGHGLLSVDRSSSKTAPKSP